MYVFKSLEDLELVPPNHPCKNYLNDIVRRLMLGVGGYDPSTDGYVVLIEVNDLYRRNLLPELPFPLAQVPWEGVMQGQGLFHGIVLTNNQFAIDIVIPDADWLSETLRESLQEHLQ